MIQYRANTDTLFELQGLSESSGSGFGETLALFDSFLQSRWEPSSNAQDDLGYGVAVSFPVASSGR
jgi:hypothetical protein